MLFAVFERFIDANGADGSDEPVCRSPIVYRDSVASRKHPARRSLRKDCASLWARLDRSVLVRHGVAFIIIVSFLIVAWEHNVGAQTVGDDEVDRDGDGFYSEGADADCNDCDAAVYPSAKELCNGIDDRCAGAVDQIEKDNDGDGYVLCTPDDGTHSWGEPATCEDPDVDTLHVIKLPGDCDDWDPARHPGATEVPNQYDDDCDFLVDEGTTYSDNDGDGWSKDAPGGSPDGYTDCDDEDPAVHPFADEGKGGPDGKDNDCDGIKDDHTSKWDDDGDEFAEEVVLDETGALRFAGGDCDDADPATYPGALELDDCIDNDCDGEPESYEDERWNAAFGCEGDCETRAGLAFIIGWWAALRGLRRRRSSAVRSGVRSFVSRRGAV